MSARNDRAVLRRRRREWDVVMPTKQIYLQGEQD
jgi:hypothetical protein